MLEVLAAGLTMAVGEGAVSATIKGVSLLQVATVLDRLDTVLSLLKTGAAINGTNKRGRTPLFYTRSRRMTQALIRHGAGPNVRDRAGQTPMHFAARHGRTEVVETLAERAGLNDRDHRGHTPLHAASAGGQLKTVESLLDLGANPNALDRHGRHPLFYAVAGGHMDCAKALIDNGSCLDLVDERGTHWLEVARAEDAATLKQWSGEREEQEAMRPWNPDAFCITKAKFYRRQQCHSESVEMSM